MTIDEFVEIYKCYDVHGELCCSCSECDDEIRTDLNEMLEQARADVIDECLHAIGGLSLDWEYGQGVNDCYEAIEQLKENKNV